MYLTDRQYDLAVERMKGKSISQLQREFGRSRSSICEMLQRIKGRLVTNGVRADDPRFKPIFQADLRGCAA